jgi:preprotein translocase subunit SecB
MTEKQPVTPQSEGEQKSIQPQKIYIKDVSFETPNSPDIFLKEWKPHLSVEVGYNGATTPDGLHEVVLVLTTTVKVDDETAYLAEVHQAGIFSIIGHSPEEVQRIHMTYCHRFLYPYACAAISDLVTRGGFQQLLLSPINFDLMYKRRLEQAQTAATTSAEE